MCKTMNWSITEGGLPKVMPFNSEPILMECESCIAKKLQNVLAVGPNPCLSDPDRLWEMLMCMTIRTYLEIKMNWIQRYMARGRCLGVLGTLKKGGTKNG